MHGREVGQRDDAALDAPGDGAADVRLARGGVPAGEDEGRECGEAFL